MRPRRDSQRPLLPQHARHCPVLEAGSAAGFLVYPPLETNESFHVEYQGEGRYQFIYCLSNPLGKWDAIFSVTFVLPVGGIGMFKEQVAFMVRALLGLTETPAADAADALAIGLTHFNMAASSMRGAVVVDRI